MSDINDRDSTLVPLAVGQYRIVRPLGENDFGSEYLATFATSGGVPLPVRLLVFRPELSGKANEALLRLRRTSALVHRGLVRSLDASSIGDRSYVAMEYQPARDLAAMMSVYQSRGEPLPLKLGLHISLEVAAVLLYIQKKVTGGTPFYHGRLSPETVLLTADGQVKLQQLGFAEAFEIIENNHPTGSPEPTSPIAADVRALAFMTRDIINVIGRPSVPPGGYALETTTVYKKLCRGPLSPETIYALENPKDFITSLTEFQDELGGPLSNDEVAKTLENVFGDEMAREGEELTSVLEEDISGETSPAMKSGTLDLKALDSLAIDDGPGTPPPQSIIADRYKVLRVLGRGGMGNVLEAEHLDLGRHVAVKLLHPRFSHDPQFAERFRREARAACKIGHQNIIDVLDFGRTRDGRLYYVMELLEGLSLEELIDEQGALEQTRAVRFLLQVCDALDAAHEAGIVHRDLKPDNLMITKEEDGTELLRVLDFGISQDETPEVARVTRTGQIVGTPSYMSPEQAKGQPTDRRSDIYSSGAILYSLITGHDVFECESVVEIMSSHLKKEPIRPRLRNPKQVIHPFLDQVVLKALKKKPEDRYQTMADLAFDLWTVLELIAVEGPAGRPSEMPSPREKISSANAVGSATAFKGKKDKDTSQKLPRFAPAAGTIVTFALVTTILYFLAFDFPADGTTIASSGPVFIGHKEQILRSGKATDGESQVSLSKQTTSRLTQPSKTPEPEKNQKNEEQAQRPQRSGTKQLQVAQALLRQRRAAEAARVFRGVLRHSPNSASAYAGLGQAEFELGQLPQSVRHLKRAVVINPSSNRIRLLYAGSLLRAGQRGEAQKQYREVLRRDPRNNLAKRMLVKLR